VAAAPAAATDLTIPIAALNFTPRMIFINRIMFVEAALALSGEPEVHGECGLVGASGRTMEKRTTAIGRLARLRPALVRWS
jgi:hypothetical protein